MPDKTGNREEEILKEIKELAILLHQKYEIFSQEEKWKSQDLCRGKPFSQLPLVNQKVMTRMAEYVSSLIDTAIEQGELKGIQEARKEFEKMIDECSIPIMDDEEMEDFLKKNKDSSVFRVVNFDKLRMRFPVVVYNIRKRHQNLKQGLALKLNQKSANRK